MPEILLEDMVPAVQIPVQPLPGTGYTEVQRFWHRAYSDLQCLEREGYRYFIVGSNDGYLGSLSDVLNVPVQTLLDELDAQVVQGHEPPGDSLISRLYFTFSTDTEVLYVAPWQYLYRLVEDSGVIL